MTDIARTGQEVWEAVRTKAGLQTKTAYDEAIVGEVAGALGLPAGGDLGAAIGRADLGPTPVLIAVLAALAPWAQMMRDLLTLMAAAGAKTTQTQLRADVDVRQAAKALKLDLRHFTEGVEAYEEIERRVASRLWSAASIHTLTDLLPRRRGDDLLADAVEAWADLYQQSRFSGTPWPGPPVAPEPTGAPALDRAVTAAFQACSSVIARLATLAPSRLALDRWWRAATPEARDRNTVELAELDNDAFPAAIVLGLHVLVARVQAGDAHGAQDLIALVDSVPVREDSVAERKALDGILSLPVWKKRYDVYANWVFTQIVDALVWTQPQIQVEDGRISFGFAAAEMARSAAFADLAVHAELGSPLKAPSKKRKEGVQPDYSVLLGDQANPADVSIVEVECKQYRQARSRNFGDALHDYAHARPGAEVVLVNYGAITPKMHELIRARVAPEVHARCHMIGDFRPGEPAALAAFRDLLDETVRRRLPTSADAIQTLAVRWNGDADLDLHLEITVGGRTDTVSYQRPGTLDAEPFAHLRRDVRSGPGPEEIVVGRWLPGTYRLSIKAHSGDMDGAEPVVTIGDRTFELPEGAGRWWDVAEIDGATGVITELAGRR